MEEGIYAKFSTSKGEILVKLTHDKTPGTVGNFVALAEGDNKAVEASNLALTNPLFVIKSMKSAGCHLM